MFHFHQTKLQHFYLHLNACFGEMEVFLHNVISFDFMYITL